MLACPWIRRSFAACSMLLVLPGEAAAATVPGQIVAKEGDIPVPLVSPMEDIRPPFVLADGTVGYVVRLADDDVAVMQDSAVLWQSSSETGSTLTSLESTMGISGTGSFIYSPLVNGDESIWTDGGPLLLEGDNAPDTDGTTTIVDLDVPRMLPNTGFLFLADVDPSGGTQEVERILYRSFDGSPQNTVAWLATTDQVDGEDLRPLTGLDSAYELSLNGSHHIHVLYADTGSADDDSRVYVDGSFVAAEATPTGDGDNWGNFDFVSINNAGNYLFGAETDGASASDVAMAYNGAIVVREGDVVAGETLTAPAQIRMLAINDRDWVTFAWNGGGVERAFFACDSGDITGTAQLVLSVGDEIDVDGDGVGDWTVNDLNANAQEVTRPLSDTGWLYLDVDINDGNGNVEAIIRIPLSCCGNGEVEPAETCDDGQDGDDTDECLDSCQSASCGDGFVWAGMEECDDANDDSSDDCIECVSAVCGDGFVWDGNEECDDGNDVETDACLSDCTPASCGDGFVQEGVEACDDANDVETDACLSDCTAASCGDGIVWEGEEACDDGNDDDTDACVSGCVEASCGDGFVQDGVEECDDGNDIDDDECANDCTIYEPPAETGEETGTETTDTGETGTDSETGGMDGSDTSADDSETTGGIFDAGEEDGCNCDARREGGGPLSLALGLMLLGWRRRSGAL